MLESNKASSIHQSINPLPKKFREKRYTATMKKTIDLYRHAETELNRKQIVQGSGVDAPINELGRKQAKAFYDLYKDRPFEVVLTSRLQRTHQTAAPFIEEKQLPWEQFEEINEIGWGTSEGKESSPEMRQLYKEMKEAWMSGDYDARLEEGESAAELGARVKVFVDHLRQRSERNILVCSHGRTMRCIITTLKDQPLSMMEDHHHDNTGLYIIHQQGDHFHFETENDIRHLEIAGLTRVDFT
jgi:broad specificity phosphatase PhoE